MPAPTARTRGVTPGRKTRITLNYPVPLCISPLFQQLRNLDDISDPKNALNSNVKYLPGIGWRLTQYQETLQALHETSVADSSVVAGTAPSGVATNKIQRKPTELTGLGTTLLRASGDNFFQKAVAAGSTWAISDGADQTAYPGPTTTQNVLLDRVFVASSDSNPVQQFWFRFFVPGTSGQTPVQEICRFYFTSIPSNRGENYTLSQPTGQYCLILHADGNAYLWEKRTYSEGDPDWILRMNEIRWCSPQNVAGRWHLVGARSDAYKSGSNYYGQNLGLFFEDIDPDKIAFADQISKSISLSANGRTLTNPTNTYKFQNSSNWQPTLAPVRVDVRRDTRIKFQNSINYYYPTGTLYSKTFTLHHYPAKTTNALKVTIYGSFPAGCSVNLEMFAADGTALTPATALTTNIDSAYRDFTPISTKTAYFVKITLNSAAGAVTPTIKSLLVARDFETIYSTPTPTVIEAVGGKGIRNISISGEGRDFTTSTASFELNDVPGAYASLLDNKSGIPVRIDTYTVNEDLSENVTCLFEGRIVKADKKVIGKKRKGGMSQTGAADGYAADKWGTYTVFCVGMWQTLFESTVPTLINYAQDPNSPTQPYKVGQAIQELFFKAGWPLAMVDVPDYTGSGVGANRFPVILDVAASLTIEPLSRVGQVIQEWARDYIGCYMNWDPNASKGGADPMGMFRVLLAPLPSHAGKYRRLAAFRTTNTSDAGITTAQGRMANVTDYAGGTCKQIWIERHSLSEYVEPPEGNYVIATGSGFISEVVQLINNLAGQDTEALVPRTLYNFPAADFGFSGGSWPAPDPTHPDYTDGRPRPIIASNKAYQTQAAIDLVARRVFDFSCHARKIKTFAAPLWFITDPDDTYQVQERPLRFGDIVTYDDVFYFVASCAIAYGFGEGQNEMMALTLMSIPALDPANGWVATNEMYKAIYSDKK